MRVSPAGAVTPSQTHTHRQTHAGSAGATNPLTYPPHRHPVPPPPAPPEQLQQSDIDSGHTDKKFTIHTYELAP